MVNYSWGDKWDERQKKEDEKRLYGPAGGGYRGGGYSGGGSDGGGKGYTSYPRRGGHTGRNVAIVLIAIVAVGGFVFLFNPLGFDFNQFFNNDNNTPRTPEQVNTDTNNDEDAKVVETVIETKKHTVLKAGAFLSSDDVRSFNLQIPNEDVNRLEGTITVDGNQFMDIEFQDAFGGLYCDECSYRIYGESSGRAENVQNNNVDIPIDSGDALKLLISNGGDAELQTVSIDLYVTYEEAVERVVQPIVEEEPEPEVSPVVEEEPEPVNTTPSQPFGSSTVENPNNLDEKSIAIKIHALVNEHREGDDLAKLLYDEELAEIALAHSEDMAENNFFDHVNPRGQDPSNRAERAGYSCYKDYGSYYTEGIAENIAQNYVHDSVVTYVGGIPIYDWLTEDEIAFAIFEQWKFSPGHNANMLEEDYDREGLGIFIVDDGKVYATQNFC